MTVEGSGQIIRNPAAGTSGGGTGYSAVGRGTNPDDLSVAIATGELGIVQFGGSDFANQPVPTVTGATHSCFWHDYNSGGNPSWSGGGYITGNGTVTLSMAATTGPGGAYMNVIVVTDGSHDCNGSS